jgi:hypothetical protein
MKLRAILCFSLAFSCATAATAQQSSPIDDLLNSARNALNDLEYQRADSIARSVLDLGDQLDYDQRQQAYQLLAAAAFPEEQAAQQSEAAIEHIRTLLRLDPAVEISTEVAWPGLDSLLEATRRSTFAVSVVPVADTVLVGRGATSLFRVSGTRPARFTLAADNERGSVVELAAEGPVAQGTLDLVVLKGDEVALPSGSYTFWITAQDLISGEELELAFDVSVRAPDLGLVAVPVSLDSNLFLPEQTVPRRGRNALIGAGLGATTALAATAFSRSDQLSEVSSGGRAYVAAGAMMVGALLGAFLERPKPIPVNIAHNEQVRADYGANVRDIMEANEARRNSYRITIIVAGEIR